MSTITYSSNNMDPETRSMLIELQKALGVAMVTLDDRAALFPLDGRHRAAVDVADWLAHIWDDIEDTLT